MINIEFPKKVLSAYSYVIKHKLFLLVPLAALTISNYVKDINNSAIREENKKLSSTVNVLITNQISRAGIVEQTKLIFWVKEFVSDEYVIVYISPEYQSFLPQEMSRYQLLGRTGKYFDERFGRIYQRNDRLAYKLAEPKIFREPYRQYGTGPILAGEFLKGKVENGEGKKLVFGMFLGKSKDQKSKFN